MWFAARAGIAGRPAPHCTRNDVLLVGFRRPGGVGVFVQVRWPGLRVNLCDWS
jgi:hypothetical protein